MAHFEKRRFIVGGKPVLVLAGEVHYFRLERRDWMDRIAKAKAAGCNAIASYIPWLYHEETEGEIDLVGKTRPERDLAAFIDLCRDQGLWFIPRPGPFTMGEIKNEGLPGWIYTKCPGAIPTTWGGKPATSKTLSYLDPDFLREVERWYAAVMPLLAKRLETVGGNIIAVQLDNEIGMLQCWTEEADLSEDVLCEFTRYVQGRYSPEELRQRYPFDLADPHERAKYLWDGTYDEARCFHSDYTEFTRDRFARYAACLRGFAEKYGVRDVPFIINLHGSGGGRATTFPIGISQNYRAYTQAPGYWGSSDHYLGEITRQNVGDLYFLNAFMTSVNRPEQPLSSVEFEAGTGDYGESGAVRQTGAATDFKARLSIVQGNRLLNHYLLAGGINPMLDKHRDDGNSRVGTTGGRHGFAAPIGPEGQLDPTYHALADTDRVLMAVGEHLAQADEEHDGIALGFVPDYYSTDVKRPGPMRELANKLESCRGALEGLVRHMLMRGLSFPAVNLQAEIPKNVRCIVLCCSPCLNREVQQQLLQFARRGGKLLLYGNLPTEDLEGRPATDIVDTLGIQMQPVRSGSPDYFPSVVGRGWASLEPEVRIWQGIPFRSSRARPFLGLHQTDLLLGAHMPLGDGEVTVITTELPAHSTLWRGIFDQLGAVPAVEHDDLHRGVILSRLRGPAGSRFISLINLDGHDKDLKITEGGRDLFGRRVFLPARRAKLLPLNVEVEGIRIIRSTAEICNRAEGRIAIRNCIEPEEFLVPYPIRVVKGAAVISSRPGGTLVKLQPARGEVWFSRA